MKKMMMIFAVLFAMVGSSFGGNVQSVTIETIQHENGMVYVYFSGGTLVTNNSLITVRNAMAFNGGSEDGKQKLAILISALQNGNKVSMWGTETSPIHAFNKYWDNLYAVYLQKK